jgi:hypothetical protein
MSKSTLLPAQISALTVPDREALAQSIVNGIECLSTKLRTIKRDINRLWKEFDVLPKGETILGCATKKEFCEKRLHRTPRTIQYLLSGGNAEYQAAQRKRSENISRVPAIAARVSTPAKLITFTEWKQQPLPALPFKRQYFVKAVEMFHKTFEHASREANCDFRKILDMLEKKPEKVKRNAADFGNLEIVIRKASEDLATLAHLIATAVKGAQ